MVKQFKKKPHNLNSQQKEGQSQLSGLFREVNKFTHEKLNPYQRKMHDLESRRGLKSSDFLETKQRKLPYSMLQGMQKKSKDRATDLK